MMKLRNLRKRSYRKLQIGYEACEKLPIVSDQEAFELDCERKRKDYGIEED